MSLCSTHLFHFQLFYFVLFFIINVKVKRFLLFGDLNSKTIYNKQTCLLYLSD